MDYLEKLQEMSAVNIREIDPDTIMEIDELKNIGRDMSRADRLKAMLDQDINPYIYKDNGIVVKVSFDESGRTLQQCMEDYLKSEMMMGNRKQA